MIALVVFLVLQHQALGVVDEWRYYTHRAGPDSVVTETSPDFSVADASSQESASRVVPGDSYEASATEDAGGKGQMDTDQVLELEEKLLKLLRSKVASNPDKLAASVLGLEAAEELLLAEEALPAIFQTIEKMYAGSKKKRTKTFQDEESYTDDLTNGGRVDDKFVPMFPIDGVSDSSHAKILHRLRRYARQHQQKYRGGGGKNNRSKGGRKGRVGGRSDDYYYEEEDDDDGTAALLAGLTLGALTLGGLLLLAAATAGTTTAGTLGTTATLVPTGK